MQTEFILQFENKLGIYECPQLFKHFKLENTDLDKFGRLRDWNVDLIPKFLMASGEWSY